MNRLAFVGNLSAADDGVVLLSQAFSHLELANSISPASRVCVKPNFTYPFYKEGVTTSPRILRAVVAALREYTQHITIVEADGGSQSWHAEQCFEGHSVPEICKEFDVRAVNLTSQPRKTVSTRVGYREVEVELPMLLLEETDLLITVPVPKVHVMTQVSLGFKNQWGCLPDVKRLKNHPDFVYKILAINKLVPARLAVFDGTYFLNRKGPMEGDPVRRDLIIAAETGIGTRVCCELMKIDPMHVPHLRLAIKESMMPRELVAGQVNVDLVPLCQQFTLERSWIDWISLGVFHSSVATTLMYNSRLSAPLHKLLYAVRGTPKDFTPVW